MVTTLRKKLSWTRFLTLVLTVLPMILELLDSSDPGKGVSLEFNRNVRDVNKIDVFVTSAGKVQSSRTVKGTDS